MLGKHFNHPESGLSKVVALLDTGMYLCQALRGLRWLFVCDEDVIRANLTNTEE